MTFADVGFGGTDVDGAMVGEDTSITATGSLSGFWRWGGGGDYSAFTTKPGAAFFTGMLDEASVYDRELSEEDVAVHWLSLIHI